jgi:hypothetical protein
MKIHIRLTLIAILFSLLGKAQNNRVSDDNSIGWVATNITWNLNKKFSLHTEYQWRRDNFVTDPQQNLYRMGVNYVVNPNLTVRLGYAYIDTYNYGDIPLQAAGRTFPEHRTYQMATLTSKIGRMDISHRFMLEQRWVGRFTNAASEKPNETVYGNRLRYMFRMQHPLAKNTSKGFPYAAMYDEILIGFGSNVNANVFDQNRFGAVLGYRFNPSVRIEGGFFSQIVQLGRYVNNQPVFQYNTGFIVTSFVNINLQKK